MCESRRNNKEERERERERERNISGIKVNFVWLESPLVRMSMVLNGLLHLEFVTGWRAGLRCMISYQKIDLCITLRFDSCILALYIWVFFLERKVKKLQNFCKCASL